MTALIEAQHVAFKYGQQPVLTDISMTIKTGEIVGLIGENGAGKTTLLNLLLGVKQAQQGQVTVFGQHPGSPLSKVKIGSMLQGDLPIQGVTVCEMLAIAAAHYPDALIPEKILAELNR